MADVYKTPESIAESLQFLRESFDKIVKHYAEDPSGTEQWFGSIYNKLVAKTDLTDYEWETVQRALSIIKGTFMISSLKVYYGYDPIESDEES